MGPIGFKKNTAVNHAVIHWCTRTYFNPKWDRHGGKNEAEEITRKTTDSFGELNGNFYEFNKIVGQV